MEQYPEYKRGEARELKLSDFPKKLPAFTLATLGYLRAHHVSPTPLLSLPTVYPTARGICFVLTGPVLCFQERITEKHSHIRFHSPGGSQVGKCVYQPLAFTDSQTVFIVEGLTDALAVQQSGGNVVSLVGAKLASDQLALLRRMLAGRKAVILPDNDEAGEACVRDLVREISVQVKRLPSQYKDVCDLPIDYRTQLLSALL